jgi:glutamate-1-semialdehyde aminotransferase
MLERARAHMPNGTPMSWMAIDNDLPVYVDRGNGPGFTDVDGFTYLDFNASDMAMFCGHANPAIVRAVQAQAERSTQFLLPTEASVAVAEELARRYPVPMWQFTLSATQANTEAIRLARAVTGREVVVLFQGHYHGHFEEGVVDLDGGRVAALERGLSKGVTGRVRIAQFNEADLLRAALEPGDVALVLTEPAMTNRVHLLAPRPGWHEALRSLTREHGTLLALDETHTHVVGPGGATALWNLEPDVVTIGKAVAGGVPMGAYGVTTPLGEELLATRQVATGGTLFGNPLSAAAAKAALTEVLTRPPTSTRAPSAASSPPGSRPRSHRGACRGPRSGSGLARDSGTAPSHAPARRRSASSTTSSPGCCACGSPTAASGRACPAPGPPCRSPPHAATSNATCRPTQTSWSSSPASVRGCRVCSSAHEPGLPTLPP